MNYPTTYQVWYDYRGKTYCDTFLNKDDAQARTDLLLTLSTDYSGVALQIIGENEDAD